MENINASSIFLIIIINERLPICNYNSSSSSKPSSFPAKDNNNMLCTACGADTENRSIKLRAAVCSAQCSSAAKSKFVQLDASSPVVAFLKAEPALITLSSGDAHRSVSDLLLDNGRYSVRRIIAEPLQRHIAAELSAGRVPQPIGKDPESDDDDDDDDDTPPNAWQMPTPSAEMDATQKLAHQAAATALSDTVQRLRALAPLQLPPPSRYTTAPSLASVGPFPVPYPSSAASAAAAATTVAPPAAAGPLETPPAPIDESDLSKIVYQRALNPAFKDPSGAQGSLPIDLVREIFAKASETELFKMLRMPAPYYKVAIDMLMPKLRGNKTAAFLMSRDAVSYYIKVKHATILKAIESGAAGQLDFTAPAIEECMELSERWADTSMTVPAGTSSPQYPVWQMSGLVLGAGGSKKIYARAKDSPADKFLSVMQCIATCAEIDPRGPIEFIRELLNGLDASTRQSSARVVVGTSSQPSVDKGDETNRLAIISAPALVALYVLKPDTESTAIRLTTITVQSSARSLWGTGDISFDKEKRYAYVCLKILRLLGDPLMHAIPHVFVSTKSEEEKTEKIYALVSLMGHTALRMMARNALYYIDKVHEFAKVWLNKKVLEYSNDSNSWLHPTSFRVLQGTARPAPSRAPETTPFDVDYNLVDEGFSYALIAYNDIAAKSKGRLDILGSEAVSKALLVTFLYGETRARAVTPFYLFVYTPGKLGEANFNVEAPFTMSAPK
jgi:hypothetical protein